MKKTFTVYISMQDSTRRLTTGSFRCLFMAFLACAVPLLRAAEPAAPAWASTMKTNPQKMEQELTATLKPWTVPALVVLPETYGAFAADGKAVAPAAIPPAPPQP